jgi:hypothetical protein
LRHACPCGGRAKRPYSARDVSRAESTGVTRCGMTASARSALERGRVFEIPPLAPGHRRIARRRPRCRPRQDVQLAQSSLRHELLAELDQGLGRRWVCHERFCRSTRRTLTCARGQGWVERPGHSQQFFLWISFAYVPVCGRKTTSRAGRAAILLFAHIALSLFQTRHTWFISRSTKALATVPFLCGDDRPFPETADSC